MHFSERSGAMDRTGITGRTTIILLLVLLPLLAISCGGEKETEKETEPAKAEGAKEESISFVDEEISFGMFFDEEGTKRTIRLDKGTDQFTGYLFLMCPDYLEIASTQYRIEIPEGVVIENDRYRWDRVMLMGTFKIGISERFVPCLTGPKILLHTFTFRVTAPLDNAVFSILPAQDVDYLIVAECKEGYPVARASAFKAVINPSD
jgi:hypothetical protein